MRRYKRTIAFGLLFAVVSTGLLAGCPASFIANLTEERSGSIVVQIINNTNYRASFTLGGYDALVLNPAGEVEIQQRRLDSMQLESEITLDCARNVAIGGEALVERIQATEQDLAAGFDLDAFNAEVNFSSAAVGSDAAALPTEGTAAGIEVRLGVDFACGDRLIFTFEENAAAIDGHLFRIDYDLLRAEDDE